MENTLGNRKRILSEVISLEAWQQPGGNPSQVNLHADVVFKEGRIGGEEASKIRFRLSVRRAELIVIIPENEPLVAIPSSVARDSIAIEGTKTSRVHRTSGMSSSAKLSSKLSTLGVRAELDGNINASMNSDAEEVFEKKQLLRPISVEQSLTVDGHYRWEMFSEVNSVLRGRPWKVIEEPRLTLVDKRVDQRKGIPPVVNIRVRCLREDIVISDISIKDEGKWSMIKSGSFFKNKLIAAQAYIRSMLVSEGLNSGDLSDPFCSIDLAYIAVDRTCV
ncbi:hypothetical protein [Rhizobium sp. NFACC06-2]|uniref:hypothetical protein n=1 Tax=Rhizobium sp. NFACC06-2 TaxID=1566264 RepID=UPI000876F9C3|nr:hypothetical protein [Rhizobium sp. NFACC06-2]SCX79964.1 hypothetical protein SAMN03159288_00224 [Rhizobium sp. NFACC06-2]